MPGSATELLDHAYRTISESLGQTGLGIVAALLILGVGWIVAAWASRAIRSASERSPRIDQTLAPLFAKMARLSVLAITIIMALDKIGIDTTSIIAFVGAMGIAVGLALKDTISDLASGIVLLVLRPFDVGNAVDVGGEIGTVKAIDLFETKLETFDGIPVVLPNSKVRSATIKNFTRARARRIELTIGIAYEADIARATAAIDQVLHDEPRVDSEAEILINVAELADSSVNLLVRAWTQPPDYLATKLDVTKAIKLALDGAGISIPYPKRDIRVTQAAS